jgi:hypothetical protein
MMLERRENVKLSRRISAALILLRTAFCIANFLTEA